MAAASCLLLLFPRLFEDRFHRAVLLPLRLELQLFGRDRCPGESFLERPHLELQSDILYQLVGLLIKELHGHHPVLFHAVAIL